MGDDELLASEHRLMVLLGCTKGIVFELDRDSRYINAWTHDELLLAAPRSELIGRTVGEVLGEAGAQWQSSVRRVYDTGVAEAIHYDLDVQGGHRWFIADLMVPPDVAGRERTVVILVRDVTAHKELEEQFRQAQKMEAIGKLAGGIAHDFNNILTTITGYADLMLESLDESSVHQRQASRIRHAAQRATALTSQLLDYARKRHLVPEILDVNVVIASMGRMLQPLIGEHIQLRLDLDPRAGGIKADRSGLEQVIMNLAINARDALARGGEITLRTELTDIDEVFAKQAEIAAGPHVVITAADNGDGMDEATRARIFEPFFTTKQVGKGTGLGLSTVYGIVKQSGGHIAVESSAGHGSQFRIYLPAVAAPVEEVARVDATPLRAANGTLVLVVEDDLDVRQLVESYLHGAGYDVLVAADPPHAIELARTRPIDLLVTDIVMPVMGGDVLAQRVRELRPAVRVLYMSGCPDAAPTERVPRVPNSVLLPKPFTPQVLIREVGAMFE